jgi:putative spermidine/putrescine transport system ATP-binding protein
MSDGLRLEGVSKRYGTNVALDDITLALPGDSYISVLGPSGAGKTVLLRVIAGFEPPDSGAVRFAGERLDALPPHRRGIGFVFQNFALFPHLSVRDNIGFGLSYRDVAPITDPRQLRASVENIIELVGLTGLADRGVHQISGGQRQRVALARTLVTEPRLVLLDEPLGALDATRRARRRSELRRIRERLGVTFLHVTGSESEALAMGDRVIVLDHGRVGQFDEPDTVYNKPATPNVARFLNCYNIFGGRIEGARFAAHGASFALPGARRAADAPAYCVRHDLIEIRPQDAPLRDGEAGIAARFVTSEYSGAAVQYFFEVEGGRAIEVEAHLSHRRPEELEPRRAYTLAWHADRAVVFG